MGKAIKEEESLDEEDIKAVNNFEHKPKKTKNKKEYHANGYRLLEKVGPHGMKFFGKVRNEEKGETAEFICPCGEAFRSQVGPIVNGQRKKCSSCK